MYFKDLSPYAYGTFYGKDRIIPLTEVLTIGWLENGYEYPKGEVDEQLVLKIRRFLVTAESNIIAYRGSHYCDFCPPTNERLWIHWGIPERALGNVELWIPSGVSPDVVYAAPGLIYHYILEHGYRPPDEFLEAVMLYNPDDLWSASKAHNTFLNRHRNRIRDAEQGEGKKD